MANLIKKLDETLSQEEVDQKHIAIEELSAYSLYQVQRSLNEFRKYQADYESKDAWERAGVDYFDGGMFGKRGSDRYKHGKEYDIEDEYRYLLAETEFTPDRGSFGAEEAEEEAEETIPEADRIDTEYSEGIGVVNQALDDSTLGEDVLNQPAVDPTDRVVEADPVSISGAEDSSSKLGGINSFKSDKGKMRTIKNESINI